MLKFLSRFMPTRQKYTQPLHHQNDLVADLDAILVEPIEFKLLGRVHTIRPMSTEQFMRITSQYANLMDLQKMPHVSAEDVIERYFAFVSIACDSISKDDIKGMTQQQCGALLNLIIGLLTGETFKKKANPLRLPPMVQEITLSM